MGELQYERNYARGTRPMFKNMEEEQLALECAVVCSDKEKAQDHKNLDEQVAGDRWEKRFASSSEKSVRSPHPYRLAAVCLGLFCALLLATTLVMFALYTSLSQKYSLLERDLEELRAKQYCPFSSQERECKPCPEGWEQFDSKCYYFSNEWKNWTASRSDCIKQGADLVIIDSKEEQDFINRGSGYYRWIGLSDLQTEGTWLWVDGTPVQGGFWKSGDPDNLYYLADLKYVNVHCAITVLSEKKWMDKPCSWEHNSVCETDALFP
ncbi:hypothetical protein GJAV_G00058640 [Gymnothorax javanicus]|nr:hypothetical protein GJAV_G00058640 [Gymnothorax javanicus]